MKIMKSPNNTLNISLTSVLLNLILAFIISLLMAKPSLAISTININQGKANPIPIAINSFDADGASQKIMNNILEVITNDLISSGLFKQVPSAAFIENKKGIDHRPLFAAWRQINATILLNGKITKLPSGEFEISFVIWDILAERDMAGEVLEVPQKLWRKAAHKIADSIYERVTGDKGYFNTRIAYIAEIPGSKKTMIKRLAIMDQDGANHSFLTDGKNLVLTPRFSPEGDKILYLAYINRKAHVHLLDLRTRRDTKLADFPGMSFTPRFSPDGRKALVSIAKDGATNIFEIDLATKKISRLTSGFDISTSPSYSPDGDKIVFNSDRNGSRQLYTINSDGSSPQRISFGSGFYYAAPTWSPRGDYIAFVKKMSGDEFCVGVMRTDGSNERIITSGYLIEGPSWAPNGRILAFERGYRVSKGMQTKSRIYMIDISGYNEREIKTPYNASNPEWSNNFD